MASIDKINEYNEGTLWPFNYDDTYIATKHVQGLPLVLIDDLISKLEKAVEDAGLFFDDEDLLKEIATGLIKGNVILQGPPGTGKTTLAAIICDVFDVKYDIITAVSDWTTYDTIGGLQPSVDDEGIAYNQVFEWFKKFLYRGFSFIGEGNINTLIYDNLFCNKLFELWNLYYIADTFQKSFGMQLLDKSAIKPGLKEYVYKLKTIDGSEIEIYYQKGAGLYWDDEHKSNWSYVDSGNLMGIPDISIKYIGEENNLTIIDIKNRVRNTGQNSEEIYKMIGYFSNFGEYLNAKYSSKYKNQAVLIFRNDESVFSEQLESNSGERMLSISTGVGTDEALSKSQFEEICKYILDVQGFVGTKSQTIISCNREMDEYQNRYKEALKNGDENTLENIIYEIEQKNHSIVKNMFSVGDLQDSLAMKCEDLQVNHFPHIWNDIDNEAMKTLAMAECLFSGLAPCSDADYAPVCLEYCRALEIQLNHSIFTPFKNSVNISQLANRNRNYEKLTSNRELTLGECIYVLEKCNAPHYATIELRSFIKNNIKHYQNLFTSCTDSLKQINVSIRRKAAHTAIMSYDELVEARQKILGIGNVNIMYTLLDKRNM